MTNDQKLLYLISKADSLLKALDKVDDTNGSSIYKDKARAERRELKIWLAGNRIVVPTKPPTVRKSPNSFNHNQNWLGR